MAARIIWPLQVWQSGTNENSLPANDNALTVEVLANAALSIADSEPGAPDEGDQHVIGTSWSGFTTNNVVIYKGGTWLEFEAFEGWAKTIGDDLCMFDGSDWVVVTSGGGGGNFNRPVQTTGASTRIYSPMDAGKFTRHTYTGAKSATFDVGEGFVANDEFWLRCEDSGDLELIFIGVSANWPPGGARDLAPGEAAIVKFNAPDNCDVVFFGGSAGSDAYMIVTEASAFTADPGTHDGLNRYIRAGGDVTFDDAEPYTAGMAFNIRATAAIELIEDGVTLTPPSGGTLEMDTAMSVTVVMTSATTADVIGQTVAA